MSMRRNCIYQTLLDHLLEKPKALDSGSYRSARAKLFPREDLFKAFLQADADQERVDLALAITQALTHSWRHCPPSRLSTNVLYTESRERGIGTRSVHGFVAKDHFVHMANLYLLGIYFYSYHSGIHRHCKRFLNRLRNDIVASPRLSVSARDIICSWNEYELFGELWSYFVLGHDIAYPLEAIQPDKRTEESSDQYLQPFSEAVDLTVSDISLKALTNFLTLDVFLREDEVLSLHEYVAHISGLFIISSCGDLRGSDLERIAGGVPGNRLSDDHEKLLGERFEKANHLPRFRGTFALRLASSLLPNESVLAVLESVSTGQPLLVVVRSEAGALVLSCKNPRTLARGLSTSSAESLVSSAFATGVPPSRNYEWEYFIVSGADHLRQALKRAFGDSTDSYEELFEIVRSRVPYALYEIGGQSGPSNTAGHVFSLLAQTLGYVAETDEDAFAQKVNRGLASAARAAESLNELGPRVFTSVWQESISSGKLDAYDLVVALPHADRKRALKKLVDEVKDSIAAAIADELEPAVRDDLKQAKTTKACRDSIAESLRTAMPELRDSNLNPFSGEVLESDKALGGLSLNRCEGVIKELSKRLVRSGLYDLQELLCDYQPRFSKEAGVAEDHWQYYDHGLAAALVYAACYRVHRAVMDYACEHPELEAEGSVLALRAALALSSAEDDLVASSFLKASVLEASTAIAMHNLYPKELAPGFREFKTSLRSSPFAYLCMLGDGLQIWDRPSQLNQALDQLPASVSGGDLDIQVTANEIRLSLRTGHHGLRAAVDRYRTSLSSYLQGADSLIAFSITESSR